MVSWDPFIRYRLVASVFQGCTQQKYKEQVIAGIIYTEKEYKTAALTLSKIMGTDECQDWFKEIVLTDYSVSRLNKVHLCQVGMQRLHSQKTLSI